MRSRSAPTTAEKSQSWEHRHEETAEALCDDDDNRNGFAQSQRHGTVGNPLVKRLAFDVFHNYKRCFHSILVSEFSGRIDFDDVRVRDSEQILKFFYYQRNTNLLAESLRVHELDCNTAT